MNGVMSINVVFTCFIGILLLYKVYILSPSPKPTNHRKLSAFFNFQNKSLSMIYRLSSSWVPQNQKCCPVFRQIFKKQTKKKSLVFEKRC